MKLIVAYIQPHKLKDVKQALYKAEIHKMSVTNALGCGEQLGYEESYRGIKFGVDLLKKVRLEIAVNEDYVKKTTAPYKYPRIIEYVDELPKTISGKILRRELRNK